MTTNPWEMSQVNAFLAELDEFNAKCGGAMRQYLVRSEDKSILAAVKRRDPVAVMLAIGVSNALKSIQIYERTDVPKQCMICLHNFDHVSASPGAFVVWLPGADEDEPGDMAVANPICRSCTKMSDELLMKTAITEVQKIWGKVEMVVEEETDETD